jgi:hypothetical protein
VLRAAANLLLSALMVITLIWGGCIACPQFFMFPTAKKDCCKAGHCERSKSHKSVPAECKRMPMEASSSLHLLCAEPPTLTAASAGLLERMQSVQRTPADLFTPVEHPPPDLQALNATFLI